MAMTLSVTACGGSDDTASAAETEEAADNEADAEPEAETEAEAEPEADAEPETETEAEPEADAADDAEADTAEGTYDSLEAFYNDPTVKSTLDTMFDAMGQEGMSIAVDAKDNELIVIIKIEDSSMVVDGMAEALEAALDSQAATFEAQVTQFDDVVGKPGACTVTMRYLDPDDNVLAEKSFKAQ